MNAFLKTAGSPARAAALAAAAVLAGCSFFSQSVPTEQVNSIHAALPPGTSIDDAEGKLGNLGFSCTGRSGSYTDENGHEVRAAQFLECVQRPRTISFRCENRDQVFVVPKNGVVDEVAVVRGPDCSQQ